jgi:hypothetical protein
MPDHKRQASGIDVSCITDAMIERGAEVLVRELGEPGEDTWCFRRAAKLVFIEMDKERASEMNQHMRRNRHILPG